MKVITTKSLRILGLISLGAAVMFIADPQAGRSRRARVRARTRHGCNSATAALARTWMRVRNTALGVMARAERLLEPGSVPDNDVLVARIQARLGHVVPHSRGIVIKADRGRVSVIGTLTSGDARKLLKAVSSVRGVSAVESRLTVERTPAAEAVH